MSTVTKRERIETTATEPLLSGSYAEKQYEAYAWRCDGCGLVWEKRWHANQCEDRGHKPSFEQGPYGVTHIENGKLMGNPTYYTRRALRREPVAPQRPVTTKTAREILGEAAYFRAKAYLGDVSPELRPHAISVFEYVLGIRQNPANRPSHVTDEQHRSICKAAQRLCSNDREPVAS